MCIFLIESNLNHQIQAGFGVEEKKTMKSAFLIIMLLFTNIAIADQVGIASYYGAKFHGKKMANGKRFNKWAISAAHRKLPLGTVIKITNLENKKSITTTVSDRGPYVKGRILDLSLGARLALDFDGLAKVSLKVIKKAEKT